jgi:AcrR family transcriptional regulator
MLTVAPERPTAVRRRRFGSSVTRQRILAASIHLFSRKGFTSTTVRDIARRAGISDATIYYHFVTKGELLREILNTRLRPDGWTTERAQSAALRGLIQEVVCEAVRQMIQVIEENHGVLRIILREGLAGDPVATCRYGQLLDDWESRLSDRLLMFESTGALARGDARLVPRQIMYAAAMAFEDMLLLRPDPSVPPAERRRQALVFLSRHIGWLLSPTCGPPASPAGIAVAVDGAGELSEHGC